MGTEAYDMLGRTSERITVSRPLNNGVISDFSMAELLISHYLKQVSGSRMFMPRVVVSVPCNVTEVEKRAVVEAITAAACGRSASSRSLWPRPSARGWISPCPTAP